MRFYLIVSSALIGLVLAVPSYNGKFEYDKGDHDATDFTKCSNDPEEEMTTIEAIRNAGYPAEEHFVKSQDGYVLALHRIPGPKGSRAVLLHHGLLESSFSWVYLGKNKALAYQLADNGYDVWLGNARGNVYSRRHTRISALDSAFWNFSWHEMGAFDVPSEIEYITSLKDVPSLYYIGHSMGCTMFFVMSNERPDILSKVKLMIALSPASYIDHFKGLTKLLVPAVQTIHQYTEGHFELLPPNPFTKYIGKCVCNQPAYRNNCRDFFGMFAGFNPDKLNTSLLPMIFTHSPAGTSLKTLFHFEQVHTRRKFIKYDYGAKKNMRIYGSPMPPEYDFSKINVPVAIMYGQNDLLTPAEDVLRSWKEMPNKAGLFKIEDPKFTHIDFIWATNAPKLVNTKVLLLLKKYDSANDEE